MNIQSRNIYLLVLVCLLVTNQLHAQLKAVFTLDTTSGCAPFTLKIKESSSGNPTQYAWDFGDGRSSAMRTPVVTYTKPGVYTLTETITSGTEQSATFSTIYVHGVPATFTYSYTDICNTPATINFTADSIDNTTKYHWDFGDNNKSIQPVANNIYTINSKYNVQLITVSSQGCEDTSSQQIQIGKGDADFLLPSIACVGQPVQLINHSVPLPKTTTWYVDNTTLTGTNTSHVFNTTGSFTIKMEADFGTCKQSVTKQVNVLSSPKATFDEAGTLVSCAYPVTVTFTNKSINATAYQWIFGDGATANTQNATHTYSTAGMFNVSLVAFNANGCADTLTKQALVKLGPPVITGFSNLPVSGCIPVTAKPKANIISPEAIVSYDWDWGDGMHNYEAEPTHAFTNAGYYRVTLTVKTASGCTGTYSMSQAVAGGAFPPVADFSVPNTNVCGNDSVRFSASATGTVTSWNWDFGDGSKSNVQNPVHQYNAPGNYTVTLYVSDKGCPSNVQKKNYLLVKPPFAKIQPVYYCDNRLKVDFKDQSVQPATWKWDFGDGNFSSTQNPTHIYTVSGQYHVKLTASNNGCSNTTDTLVSVIDSKPKITVVPASGVICRNDSVSINTNNTTYISDYLWNLADGTTIFGNSNIKYAYKKAGSFNPYLIVNYVNGCKDTTTLNGGIQVYGPTAGFRVPANVCLNNAVAFTDTSHTDGLHAIKNWQWSDGENNIIQQSSAPFLHKYTTGGNYTPTLKITDAFGCTDSIAATMPITVKGATAAFNYAMLNASCSAALFNFTNQSITSNDAIAHYNWSFGDGDSAFIENPQHNYTQSNGGQQQVSLMVTTASGCTDTAIQNINVHITEAPKAVMNVPLTACVHQPISFTATQTGDTNATQWIWDFGNGATSNEQNTSYTYNNPTRYQITLIASTGNACGDTVKQTIIVNPLPVVDAGEDLVVCAGKTVSLNAAGAVVYNWQPVLDLSCADCATPIASPATTTKYYVKGTDNNGCANIDSVLVTVQQQTHLSIAKNNISLCMGDSVMLAASGSDVYLWQPALDLNNSTIANPIAKPSATTDYTVTATDKYQCFTTSAQVHVVVNNKPVFDIADSLLTLNKGATQQLQTSSSADVVNWFWQPQQGLSCYNCSDPILTANQQLTYTATATTADGCAATDEVRIAILCDKSNLYIPSAFTPNRDGKNDRFYPLSTGGSNQKIKSFDIYNSTGQRVFSKQNIYTNSYTDGWDGSYKGLILNGGVFVYKIITECNGNIIPLTGTVTLLH